MQDNDDLILQSNTSISYSEKRNTLIKILQDNPPKKNNKDEFYSYCLRSIRHYAPEFPTTAEEKEESMKFLDVLIESFLMQK